MTGVDDPRGSHRPGAWPPTADMLLDTSRCPACFTPISASPCASCGLDLSDPRTFGVLSLSQRIAELVAARERALGEIRAGATAAPPAPGGWPAPAPLPGTVPAAPLPPAHVEAPVVAAAAAPVTPAAAAPLAPAEVAPAASAEAERESVTAAAHDVGAPVASPPGFAPPAGELHPVLPGAVSPVAPGDPGVEPAGPRSPEAVAGPAGPGAPAPVAGVAGPGTAGPAGPGTPAPVAGPAKPRRSGVQVFLLSVGVVLLAVAAAFFLTVAWVSGGLVLRSIIVGLVTAAVIVTASVLRRRALGATAEGIALLGIAFVALDVWAVRANDLAGAAGTDAGVYWGWAAVVAGAAFVVWARIARLRAPLSAGIAALAVGPPLVVAGLVSGDAAVRWYAAGLTILLIALAAPLVPRLARAGTGALTVEVAVLRALAGIGALAALASAIVRDPETPWAPVAATLPVAVLLAAHAWVLVRQGPRPIAPVASTLAVLTLGAGVAATSVRLADATFAATAPLLIAVVVALVLEAAASRAATGVARTTVGTAAIVAGVGAVLAALAPIVWTLSAFGAPLLAVVPFFSDTALQTFTMDAASTAAALTLVAAVALAALAWRLTGRWPARRDAALWSGASVAMLVGPQVRVTVAIVAWYVLLSLTAVVLLRRRRGAIVVSIVIGSAALTTGWVLSLSSPLTWTIATLAVIAVLWLVAPVAAGTRVPAVVALVLFATGSGLLAPSALRAGLDVSIPGGNELVAVASIAVLCLVGALALVRGLDARQREAGFLTALVITALTLVVPSLLRFGDPAEGGWWVAIGLVSAAAAVGVVALPATRGWRIARPAAAVLSAPLAGAAGLAIARVFSTRVLPESIALGTVALLAAALGLAFLRRQLLIRALVDAGAAVVAVVSVTLFAPAGVLWLTLLFFAAAVVLWAVDADGLFVSRGPRRHLIWLSVALAAVALWVQLVADRVENVEAYTLPLAAVLLFLAGAHERARRRVDGRAVAVPPVIAFAGAALAVVPTAVAGGHDIVRLLVAGLASAALVVAGAWIRPARTPDALPVALAGAGALGLLLVCASRLVSFADAGTTGGAAADVLVVAVAAVLVAGAVGLARRAAPWALPVARATVIASLAIAAVGEAVLVVVDTGPTVRAVLVVVLLGAVAPAVTRAPGRLVSTPLVETSLAGVALGGAALVAAAGLLVGVRPIEWMTVPLAFVLLLAALTWRQPRAGAVPVTLAAVGLAVGLLPSAALAADDLPRAITVTVVAVLVLLVVSTVDHAAVRPLLIPGLAVGAPALLLVGAIRTVVELDRPAFDLWLIPVAAALLVVALLLRRRTDVPATLSTAAVLAALAFAAATSCARLVATGEGPLRAAVTVVAVLAVGMLWRGVSSAVVFWSSIGLASITGAVALAAGAADPVEVVSVPIAAALIAHGIRSLRSRPELRSWPALGVGVALLLLPSLVFDFASDNALWRIIGLGLVALAVLLAGARTKLQAPVLLGGIVLLVHAVAQLWPWIAAVYGNVSGLWWLWLGIAGVLLIVVAATYERRIRELKAVALAIRALR